jgi:hypothetical protein
MMNIVSRDELLQKRRSASDVIRLQYVLPGSAGPVERVAETKLVNGELEAFELTRPIGELMTTPAGLEDVVRNSLIDIQSGREAVPLLYKPIYRTIENRGFTRFVDTTPFTSAQVVFLEKMELEEVFFGTRTIGPKQTIPMVTWAAGFQWTEDLEEYDETWQVQESNRAMGEAYNALLNHLQNTLKNALKHANEDRNTQTRRVRQPSILLAHPKHRWDLEEALMRMVVDGSEIPALGRSPWGGGIDTLVFYDGYEITVGEKTYTYNPVPQDKVYLIDRGAGGNHFVELIKHDLIVDAGGADLTRLVKDAIVGRARRGAFMNLHDAVEEVTLPTP